MQQGCLHLVWLRDDLRTDDHPALIEAVEQARRDGGAVACLYVYDPALWGRPLGGASLWWLHYSLAHLTEALAELNIPLILRQGRCETVVPQVARRSGAQSVVWTPGQTPFLRQCEGKVAAALESLPLAVQTPGNALLAEPGALTTASGKPYRVFTPFWKALASLMQPLPEPVATPDPLPQAPTGLEQGERLEDWGWLPQSPDWAPGLRAHWLCGEEGSPGEDGGLNRLGGFFDEALLHYTGQRDLPAVAGTSRLSAHLRFGEISPRRLWHVLETMFGERATPFLRQLGWREFNHHLLFQAPDLAERPLQAAFEVFPWRDDEAQFRRWCLGMTGFPIVDAGQRELWQTGWMHNRVRMISASFLVKDLLLPWQWGEAWMWDTLVDACPANNPANWQWVAGCGADAAPYFRVFNPTLQAQKFDPDGAYQREWVPESVHPGAGGDLFASPARYPRPMVDHAAARVRALEALQQMKDDADR
jgi:deoxyribodipyrimidine photo-lyase